MKRQTLSPCSDCSFCPEAGLDDEGLCPRCSPEGCSRCGRDFAVNPNATLCSDCIGPRRKLRDVLSEIVEHMALCGMADQGKGELLYFQAKHALGHNLQTED